MGDIKSAREIAMEKVEKLGELTEEERLRWKYVPQGEELGAKYLKGDCNLVAELGKYQGNVKKYVAAGPVNCTCVLPAYSTDAAPSSGFE